MKVHTNLKASWWKGMNVSTSNGIYAKDNISLLLTHCFKNSKKLDGRSAATVPWQLPTLIHYSCAPDLLAWLDYSPVLTLSSFPMQRVFASSMWAVARVGLCTVTLPQKGRWCGQDLLAVSYKATSLCWAKEATWHTQQLTYLHISSCGVFGVDICKNKDISN